MIPTLDYPALTDRRLVELHLGGNREAFRQIVERHQGMVCALAMSACGDIERSEDVAQEVFIVAWQQLAELREPEKLRGWLGGITRNLVSSATRQQRRTPTARAELISDQTPAAGDSPREQATSADEVALMWRMLAGIPEIYREPMVLYYREQRSVPVVAVTLEISEDLVRQRLVRGRAMLNERMAALVEETLVRTAPTEVFAGAVMLALPLVGAEAGAFGGIVVKTATLAGAVGGAAAKGGLAMKGVAVIGVLPVLLSGAMAFRKFRTQQDALDDDSDRRRTAWAYFFFQGSIGVMFVSLLFGSSRFVTRASSMSLPITTAAVFLISVVVCLWAYCRLSKRIDLLADTTNEPTRGFEYRSATTWFGLPLVHVRMDGEMNGQSLRRPVVRAWIAISSGRAVGGLFAFGLIAIGPLSMGGLAVGALGLGLVSLGLGVIGGIAIGGLAHGMLAIGARAASGGVAIAGDYAQSELVAYAPHTETAAVAAFFHDHVFFQYAEVVGEAAMKMSFFGWVAPLALMSWHLFRKNRNAGRS